MSVLVTGSVAANVIWDTVSRFGQIPSRADGELYYPSGVAVDHATGDVFVSDSLNSRIQRFTATGIFLNKWQFSQGIGLTVDPLDSSVYIGSEKDKKIHKFDPLGNELLAWDGAATTQGSFSGLRDVAVNTVTGNVFVLDSNNKQVHEYTSLGGYVNSWLVDNNLSVPYGIDVDPTGTYVWIANTGGVSIRKYDLSGNLLLAHGSEGSAPGFFRWPRGIAIDSAGNPFVADTDMERVQKFDSSANFLQTFMGPHNDAQGPAHPRAIDVNRTTGDVYTAAAYANRIDRFDASGNQLGSWGHHDRDGLFLSTPQGITVDPLNKWVYVADTYNHLIKKFTFDGTFLAQLGNWPLVHRDETALSFPRPVATDAYGNYWALNEGINYPDDPTWGSDEYVRQFDSNGNYLFGFAHPDFTGAMGGLAVNRDRDELYVANTREDKIMWFDFLGNLLGEWGTQGSGPGEFKTLAGVAVNHSQNTVYVVDSGNERIQIFTLNGTYLGSFGEAGSGPGQFNLTTFSTLTFDEHGNVFVADTTNHRIQVFDPAGNFIDKFGVYGSGAGKFRTPRAVAYADGKLFVIETSEREVEVLQVVVGPGAADTVWVDDAVPAGASEAGTWTFTAPTATVPVSGSLVLQSDAAAGQHQHFFFNASERLNISEGDTLFAYVYLDPANPPREVMLQWNANGSWNHRAYWGEDLIGWGTKGTESRYHAGPLPAIGGWIRLEVPASAVGMEGLSARGMAFTLYDGEALWDAAGKSGEVTPPPPPPPPVTGTTWVEDAVPAGAVEVGTWTFEATTDPVPVSGLLALRSDASAGVHQHFFHKATDQLTVITGDTLFAYVYLDPANPPREVMLQWNAGGSWNHRAYWGENLINWGTDGTASRYNAGPLPATGGWVRLEVPASAVGMEGLNARGMAFTLYGGEALWDAAGTL